PSRIAFLYLGFFRALFGSIGLAGGTFPTRSRASLRTSFRTSNFFLRAICRAPTSVAAKRRRFDIIGIRYLMKKLLLPLMAICLLFAQNEANRRETTDPRRDTNLPNGKSQQEEILKAEHEKTLQDAAQLVKLSEELQDDLIKEDRHVLSLASLKKAEDIEKLDRKSTR